MRRAVALAARGRSSALPNPVVGCVLLAADGTAVGEGWHERPGGPHAEVVALRAAGSRARGATAVVTLEPCNHTGRTGPCTQALLAAGVARVVAAVRDPWPPAAGGIEVLRAGGVDVDVGMAAEEAERVNEVWLTATRLGRPFVTWKLAATLDGRSGAADGTSRWITGTAARADVHRLRAEVDTMLVGVGTVLADDPHLTVRHPDGTLADRQPLRVVADSRGRTPAHARIRDGAAATWIATCAEVAQAAGPAATDRVPIDPAPTGTERVPPAALLAALYARGQRHVLLEGGPTLAGSFVGAGLVDRVVAYLSPALLGAGPAALGDAGIRSMAGILRLQVSDVETVGEDLRITARPRPPVGPVGSPGPAAPAAPVDPVGSVGPGSPSGGRGG